jgi:hypothetical protein
MAGVAVGLGLGAASFAQALELTAVDYGAKIGSAMSLSDIAAATQLIADLKSCGVSALNWDTGSVSIVDLEASLAGGGLVDASLLMAVSGFVVDQNTVASVRCAATPVVGENPGVTGSGGNFPVGSTG